MNCKPSHARNLLVVLLVVLATAASARAAPVTATWTGGGGNCLWSNSANWDVPLPPCNSGPTEFDVIIPAGVTVCCDMPACEITGLTLPFGSTLAISAGSDLTVLDTAAISGHVDANGGIFTAIGPGANLNDGASLRARNAGVLTIQDQDGAYSTAPLPHGTYFFRSEDAGSAINLPGLNTIEVSMFINGAGWHEMRAEAGGTIDLSDAVSINAPGDSSDTFYLQALSGGTIQLDALESMGGAALTRVLASASSLELPSLTDVQRVFFQAVSGGVMNVTALEHYSSTGIPHGFFFFSAEGTGSQLNMPALTSMEVAMFINGAGAHELRVENGAAMDLSALVSIDAAGDGDDTFYLQALSGGTIQLDALESMGGAALTRILANASSLELPSLIEVPRVYFRAISGGVMNVTALEHYSSTGIPHGFFFFSAEGTGSQLNMPALTSMEVAMFINGAGAHELRVENGAAMDLSALVSIDAAGDGDDTFYLQALSGGTIQLDALESMGGAALTRVLASASSLELPSLIEVPRVYFRAISGGVMNVTALEHYSSAGIPHGFFFFSAEGTGSQLNMPALTSMEVAMFINGAGAHELRVENGAAMDLSALVSIDAAGDSGDTFYLQALSGASIVTSVRDMTGASRVLCTVNTGAEVWLDGWENMTAVVEIHVRDDSTLHVAGDLAAPGSPLVTIDLEDAGSSLDVAGSFLLGHKVELTTAEDSVLTVGGHRFCHANTDEFAVDVGSATVHLDGAVEQRLEAGGFDVGLLCGFGDPNFGIGHLVIGADAQATTVQVWDGVGNGNGLPEALYIYGGLELRGGSTIVLNDINVYVFDDCADGVPVNPVHLNELLGGADCVPFDDGFVCAGQPRARSDVNDDGCVDVADLVAVILAWGECAELCFEDVDCDGAVSVGDLTQVILNWGCLP